jgi:hypothetical protein
MHRLTAPLCVFIALTGLVSNSREAAAQVSTTGKGIVGCGLLGAEVVVIGEAVAGLDEEWLYWAGAGIGAVGGATGGYFLEPSMSPQTSVLVLMGGMALSIPALIVSLDATRRHWPDAPPAEPNRELPPNPPDPGSGRELVFQPLPIDATPVVGWSPEGVQWAIPSVHLSDTYTRWERWAFALPPSTDYTVPVLNARF